MRDYKKTISDLRNFNANYEANKLTNDAADAIEELLKENAELDNSGRVLMAAFARLKEKVPKWISVEERLPDEWREVLTYSPIHSDEKNPHMIQLCWYIGFGKWRECQYGEIIEIPITHWMSLPAPPKEETKCKN